MVIAQHGEPELSALSALNVLQVNPSFFPATIYGGTVQSGLHMSTALAEQGCTVRVLTTDANGSESVLDVEKGADTELPGPLRVRYCHRIAGQTVSPELLRVLRTYVAWADVVHLTAVYSFPIIPTLLASRLLGKPVVWSPRGALQRWSGSTQRTAKSLWELACRAALPRRIVLHFTSEEEKAESVHRIPGVTTVVIPNGVDLPSKLGEPGSTNCLRLAFLGRIHPKKGLENLVDAGRLLARRSELEWSLRIAGPGDADYVETIRKRVCQYGLESRVKFVGEITGNERGEFLRNADVVVVPSHTENFGMVVAEALAHGIPVVVSRGAPWSRVEEMGCGLWVDNDAATLCDAILRMTHESLREAGHRGRTWMESEFAWSARARDIIDVYVEVLRNVG